MMRSVFRGKNLNECDEKEQASIWFDDPDQDYYHIFKWKVGIPFWVCIGFR
jgi:hypothetical protein